MRKYSFPVDLQLFAEGGGSGAAAAGASGQATAAAAPAQPQNTGANGNPLANVQYGRQEAASPDAGEARIAEDDRSARFDAMIKGEFKDLYDAKIQDTIRKRLKGSEETVKKYQQLSGSFDLLASKYGLDLNDADFTSKLAQAIEADESYFEEEALEKGMTVQQVRENRQLKRENAQLVEQLKERTTQEQADRTLAAWNQQAEQVKKIYPGFDLSAELQNEQFRNLLKSNVPIQTAFEVIHKDEILPAAMQYTAQQVTQKVANSVRAGQNRPAEGAMGKSAAVLTKTDVNSLTKADIEEINRRVARGERVVF